jgi:SAM-dependent methyltransferase
MRLLALCRHGECSVSELTQVVGLSQPRTSQHLKQLCGAGLLQRFRDGQRMFYRVPQRHGGQQLQDLIPVDDPVFRQDMEILRQLRGRTVADIADDVADTAADRAIYREFVELTVTAPLGDVLDVGCGRGKIIKLLASRANRVVGLDLDANARQFARAELMLAGIPNCSLRKGDMNRMPFGDAEFDTLILDEVVASAADPTQVFREAKRLLRPGGRLFVLESVAGRSHSTVERLIADSSGAAGLRIAPARLAPKLNPVWLLSVATPAIRNSAASQQQPIQETA